MTYFHNDKEEIVDKMWKNSFPKALYNKGFKGMLPVLIIWANFTSTYTFTLGKWVFFGLFSLPQNLKMASCKGYRVLVRSKKAKKKRRIYWFFENWDPFKGTLRAFLRHSWRGSESLEKKGSEEGEIGTESRPLFFCIGGKSFRLTVRKIEIAASFHSSFLMLGYYILLLIPWCLNGWGFLRKVVEVWRIL